MAELIQVEVCYALPTHTWRRTLAVAPGATLEQAVRQSGLLDEVAGIDLAVQAVGIFAKKKPLATILRAQDRVEVYRPLLADPKETRRRRAASKKRAA